MVLMKEFRIVMPMSLEEYQVAQMYMVRKMQQQNTTSTEGVEILENKSFEDDVLGKGHYSSKIYRLQSKAPTWLTTFAPADALIMQEEAWNAYPRCKTVIKCPYFTKFQLTIETVHRADNGQSDNVHGLSKGQLATRDVEIVDIASSARDYWSYVVSSSNTDLSKFTSAKTGRGPLLEGWQDKSKPVMTAYKLVTIDAPYWGFGYRIENALLLGERALFLESHRNCFAWIDEWFGLTVEQIRELEQQSDSLKEELGRPTLVKSVEDFDQRLLPESEDIYSGQRAQLST
ncbi:PREDICTED: phosphatidylinositol transfer [Prunus dulcis]|uniref:PREDICTED: phosphatidylinositol transfer n=1 Tax=Prunus dulcis TaxID=3755 RepID=A0A5E4F1D2_PRUDU|nr:phosphatidylinositol transfer protein 1-like [Prunus dulcis]KAI5322216.1 hypothetical protein L3X38_031288 [Prunus dulcis]VVA20859.1 PREDICTED: phosphatidylinositol transfer [Prunus dulcis]